MTTLLRLALAGVLLVGFALLPTADLGRTETITVPNPQTGVDMQLEVHKGPAASAEAASYATVDCYRRWTNQVVIQLSSGYYHYGVGCNMTRGTGGNSVRRVMDQSGPICIYYFATLAGCAGKGSWAYVDNRSGQAARVATQPLYS